MSSEQDLNRPDLEFEDDLELEDDPSLEIMRDIMEIEVEEDEEEDSSRKESVSEESGDLVSRIKEAEAKLKEMDGRTSEARAIKEGILDLKNVILQNRGDAPRQPGESEKEFQTRFNEKVFEGEDTYGLMNEMYNRKAGPAFRAILERELKMQRKLLALDPKRGETYSRFKKEIDAKVDALTDQEKFKDDEVYERAHDEVVFSHRDELQAESVEDLVNQAVNARLRELGIDPSKGKRKASRRNHQEIGGNRPRKRTVTKRINPEEVLTEAQKSFARAKGMPLKEYVRYLARKGELKV